MTLIGGYRYSGATSGSTATPTIVNVGTFKISGLGDTGGLICCLYKWDATNSIWIPYT